MVHNMNERVHVHVSPGSAETLVRRRGITNHHLIAYSLSNISAKNYQNRLMCSEVIVCNISVGFLRHHVDQYLCDVNIIYRVGQKTGLFLEACNSRIYVDIE